MQKIEFPMHLEGGYLVRLVHVLKHLPDNNWIWTILEFEGTGRPRNDTWPGIDKKAEQATGYKMTWQELNTFAEDLHQTIDCVIAAVQSEAEIDRLKIVRQDFGGCRAAIVALDSWTWSIYISDETKLGYPIEELQKAIVNSAKKR